MDKEKKKLIIQKVGKSLSLWDSIFNTIRGSHRMIIDSYSSGFEGFLRKDNNILYASTYQRRRHFGILVAGGSEGGIYKSIDKGKTWKKLKNGLPSGDIGRIGLAISPQKANVVYAFLL